MHWADEASAELLEELLYRPPSVPHLLVVASRRRGAGAALRMLGAARHRPGFEELLLAPLDRDASLALLTDVPDEGERARMAEESRGNPLYLTEFARAAGRPMSPLTCPLLGSVEVELVTLSPGARTLVEGAAVAGDPFDPELAAAAAGLEQDASAVDELVAADLVRPIGDGRDFAFRHPMVCRAVYHGASPAWRLAAHERAAAALERRGASLPARARHVARYARPGDEAAISLLAEAGGAASGAAAAHWYEKALALLPDAERGRLLGPTGLALARAGRLREGRDALAEALVAATEPGLVIACARLDALLGDPDSARRRLHAAYDAAPQAALAFERALVARGEEERREWTERAGDTADPLLLAGIEAPDRAFERLRDIDDATLAANLPVVAQIARSQLLAERLDDASATVARALAIARRTHQEDTLVALHEIRATVLWLQLDLDGALREAEAAEDTARRQDVPYIPRLRALLHHDRGEVAEAERCMNESVPGRLDPADRWAAHATQLQLPGERRPRRVRPRRDPARGRRRGGCRLPGRAGRGRRRAHPGAARRRRGAPARRPRPRRRGRHRAREGRAPAGGRRRRPRRRAPPARRRRPRAAQARHARLPAQPPRGRRRPHRPRADRRRAGRRGPLQQAGRRGALPQRGNHREHPYARLRQARRALTHPAHARAGQCVSGNAPAS